MTYRQIDAERAWRGEYRALETVRRAWFIDCACNDETFLRVYGWTVEALNRAKKQWELPPWPGAETVYQRVQNINGARCKNSYSEWINSRKKSKDWRAPDDIVDHIIPAMNRGDEEILKVYVAQWPQFWS